MNIVEYCDTIKEKRNCPNECSLKNNVKTNSVVVNLPSEEIIGIVISRDPTYTWYQEVNEHHGDPFEKGIPGKLIEKSKIFMGTKLSDKEIESFRNVMYKNIYWTHLHKCFTDRNTCHAPKFSIKNAKCCADKWLGQEVITVINQYNVKFIIALGNDVQKWIGKWQECNKYLLKDIQVVNLLHTSDQNDIIWHRRAVNIIEDTEKALTTLSGICSIEKKANID